MNTTHTLHTAKIKNNCPECFANNGLEFSFTQDQISKKLYTKATSSIVEKLYCTTCNNTIYPVSWDDNIERVYTYNKKQAIPKKAGIRLTKLGYGILFISLLISAILVYIALTIN